MRLSVNSIHCASSDAIEGKADIGRSSGLLWRDAIDPLGHSVRVFVAMHRTDPLQTCYTNFAILSLGQARMRRREFIRLIGATAGPFEGVDERVIAARNLDRGAGGASGGEGGGVSWRRMRPRLDSRGGRSRIGMTVAGRAIGLLRCALIAAAIAPLPAAAEPLLMDVARAELGYDRRTGEPLVAFVLTQPSARAFAQLTAANIGFIAGATKYIVTDIYVANCSASLTTAKGALYTAASKTGTSQSLYPATALLNSAASPWPYAVAMRAKKPTAG